MSDLMISGFFALGGAVVGGLFTFLAARVGHRWSEARSSIARLCAQVAAFYELEELYKVELAALDPSGRSAATIMKDMRSRVAESEQNERPSMTSNMAAEIRRQWLG